MPPTNLQKILENSSLNNTNKKTRIQAFIDAGGDINMLEENGNPTLLNEMQYGTDQTVNLLLDLGADVNVKSKNNSNALLYSANFTKKLALDTYKRIIDKTNNLNSINQANNTALILFASTNEGEILTQNKDNAAKVVEVLIEKSADPNINGSDKNPALFIAITYMNDDIALNIAKARTLDINSPQSGGQSTYLILAIKNNMPKVIRTLLDQGADPSALTADRKTSPLLTAIGADIRNITTKKRQELIRLLLEKGANKDISNNLGVFPYDIANIDTVGEELYNKLKPTIILPNTTEDDRIYTINRTVANSILSTAPITRQNPTTQIPIYKGKTIPVYDAIEAGEVDLKRTEIEEDTENIYFKIGATYSRLPYDALNNALRDFDAIQFECKREMVLDRDGTPKLADVHLERPYYLISTTAKYLVPLGEIIWALSDGAPHIFELSIQGTLAHVSSFKSIQRPYQTGNSTLLNYSGRSFNIVGKDHCTVGTKRLVYTLTPITFIDALAVGGKKRKLLSTRKNKIKKYSKKYKTRHNKSKNTQI
jgi:ankyrin repeat protein